MPKSNKAVFNQFVPRIRTSQGPLWTSLVQHWGSVISLRWQYSTNRSGASIRMPWPR